MILLDSTYDSASTAPSDVHALNKGLVGQDQLLSREMSILLRKIAEVPSIAEGASSGDASVNRNEDLRKIASVSEALKDIPKPEYALEHWLVQAHAYSEKEACKVGLFSSLFSGEANRVKGGVIHDAKRFSYDKTRTDRKVEVGVAVRLSVATSNTTAESKLNLPSLAAEAQLNNIDTRVGISVIGYTGALGELLPAPRKLDVETCVDYINAFNKIQKLIFGEEGWPHVVPTVLAYDEKDTLGPRRV